jgi:hypothetical protein
MFIVTPICFRALCRTTASDCEIASPALMSSVKVNPFG